jgi:hypothetical protein
MIMRKIRQISKAPRGLNRAGLILLNIAVLVLLSSAAPALRNVAFAAENVASVSAAKPRGATRGPWWEVTVLPEHTKLPPQAVSTIAARIDLQPWRTSETKQIDIPVPGEKPGVIESIRIEGMEHQGVKGGAVWRGTVAGDEGSTATFSVFKDGLVGDVRTSDGKLYRISYGAPDLMLVMTLNPRKFPAEDQEVEPSRKTHDTRESR